MIIPDICNVLSTSGKEFSLSHWYSPIIDSWVTKIEVQRKHLFQIFRIYWIDSLFNMQVFWDLRMQWSNCPYFVAKKDLHWIYLVEKGKSGYSCQDAKFRSTPIWWNMQEIFHGFDKSRAMWVFQHKYSFLVTIVETQWRESTLLKNWWPSWNSCHNLSRQTNQDSLMQRLSRGKNSKLLVLNERKKFHRKYHLLSRERVQPFIDAEEKVNQLPGVSKIHQAFSTGER